MYCLSCWIFHCAERKTTAQRLIEKSNLNINKQSCTSIADVRHEDVDGGIGDFPNCKMGKRNQPALPGLELRKSDASGYPAMASSVRLKSRVAASLFWSSCLVENIAKDHFPRVFCTKHVAPYLHGNSCCSDTARDSFPSWG